MYLVADGIDQPRPLEYLISIVDNRNVVRSFFGRMNFTKARFLFLHSVMQACDVEMRDCYMLKRSTSISVFYLKKRSNVFIKF